MAPNQNIDETIVRVREDGAARLKVQRGLRDIIQDLRGLGTEADRALDQRFENATRKGIQSLKSLRSEAKATKDELRGFSDVNFGDLEGGGAGGGRSSRLRGLGRAARVNLPAVPIGAFSSEQIARGVEGVGALEDVIGNLGVKGKLAAGAIGAAAIAIGVILARTIQQAKEARAVADAAFEGNKKYLELIATGTQESINEELERVRIQRQAAAEQRLFTAQVLSGLEDAVAAGGVFNQVTAEAGAITGLGAQELASAREAAAAANKEYQQLTAQENALERARGSQEVITRSAAEAEKRLADERQRSADQALVNQVELLKRFSTENDTGSIDKLLRSRVAEKEIIQATLATLDESDSAYQIFRDQLTAVSSEISTLALLIRPEVAEREKEADAVKKITGLFNGLVGGIKAAGESIEEVNEAAQRIEELRQSHSDKLADIERRKNERIEDAQRDLSDRLAEIQLSAKDDLAEAERDAQIDRVKQQESHEKEIQRIRRRSLVDEQTAIQNRDAVALEAARTRRDEELAQENEDNAERRKEIERNLQEQRRTIDRALKEQTRLARLRYNQQVRDAGIAAQRSVEVERQKFNAELQVRIAAAQQAVSIAFNGEKNRNQVVAQGAQDRLNIEAAFVKAGVNLWNSALQAISGQSIQSKGATGFTGTGSSGVQTVRGIPVFERGGVMPHDGLAYVHKGEVITNPRRGQSAGSGFTLNINFSGATMKTIQTQSRQETVRQLNEFLIGMGAA